VNQAKSHWNIHLRPVGMNSTIVKDGEDISKQVSGLLVETGVGETTKITVEYTAADVELEVDEGIEITSLADDHKRYRVGVAE